MYSHKCFFTINIKTMILHRQSQRNQHTYQYIQRQLRIHHKCTNTVPGLPSSLGTYGRQGDNLFSFNIGAEDHKVEFEACSREP